MGSMTTSSIAVGCETTELVLLVTFPDSFPEGPFAEKLLVISPRALRVLRLEERPLVGLETSPTGSASEYLLDWRIILLVELSIL